MPAFSLAPTRGLTTRYLPLALLLAVIAGLGLGAHDGISPVAEAALLIGFAILSWASGLFPEPVTTLLFFLLAVVGHVARPAVVFSGFASPAWWLVLGGSITAIAVQTSGLGRRLAGLLFGRVAGA